MRIACLSLFATLLAASADLAVTAEPIDRRQFDQNTHLLRRQGFQDLGTASTKGGSVVGGKTDASNNSDQADPNTPALDTNITLTSSDVDNFVQTFDDAELDPDPNEADVPAFVLPVAGGSNGSSSNEQFARRQDPQQYRLAYTTKGIRSADDNHTLWGIPCNSSQLVEALQGLHDIAQAQAANSSERLDAFNATSNNMIMMVQSASVKVGWRFFAYAVQVFLNHTMAHQGMVNATYVAMYRDAANVSAVDIAVMPAIVTAHLPNDQNFVANGASSQLGQNDEQSDSSSNSAPLNQDQSNTTAASQQGAGSGPSRSLQAFGKGLRANHRFWAKISGTNLLFAFTLRRVALSNADLRTLSDRGRDLIHFVGPGKERFEIVMPLVSAATTAASSATAVFTLKAMVKISTETALELLASTIDVAQRARNPRYRGLEGSLYDDSKRLVATVAITAVNVLADGSFKSLLDPIPEDSVSSFSSSSGASLASSGSSSSSLYSAAGIQAGVDASLGWCKVIWGVLSSCLGIYHDEL